MSAPTAPVRAPLLLAAVAAVVLLLGGCGSDDGSGAAPDTGSGDTSTSPDPGDATSTEGTTEPAPPWPACAKVWHDGARLPNGYRGCLEGAGKTVKADRYPCSSGQRLITFDDQYYATAGGTITRTQGPVRQDGGFRRVLATCQG